MTRHDASGIASLLLLSMLRVAVEQLVFRRTHSSTKPNTRSAFFVLFPRRPLHTSRACISYYSADRAVEPVFSFRYAGHCC
ncbi:hypothetical protein F4777DRAFT_532861 [Nemania sp. FL0916]|nr:hypothetical protein F4777DRAFT_532861 [Nemania sp. FL0916]